MFISEDRDFIEEVINESESKTDSFMSKVNNALFDMLKNPTDEQIKKFRDTRDALLVGWLLAMMEDARPDFYQAAQIGIDVADRQLAEKGIKEIKNKNITKNTFLEKVDSRIDSLQQDLTAITESIKSNSEKIIKELKSSPTANGLKEQKKISSEIAADLQEKGITFFTDKIGRKTPIEKYVRMRVFTDSVTIQRTSYFVRAIQYGVDLVRIVHLNIHPTCELCAPFEGKILSINGDEAGYMTIEQAENYGLFHPNCDHIPEELELAPVDKGGEGVINLNKANEKRLEYNNKKSMI
ncbi:MAG: hypothetical protein IJX99_05485 [Clostridia bacterium]|nr:hypothetical protein [Clostridia bacterium]